MITTQFFLRLPKVGHHASQLITLDNLCDLVGVHDLLLISQRLLREDCLRLLLKHVLLIDEGIHLIRVVLVHLIIVDG